MQYVKDLKDGSSVNDIYLCTKAVEATKKNGDPYINAIFRDKTGEIDSKVWDPDSPGIESFSEGDFVFVRGDVKLYSGKNQLTVRGAKVAKAGEYDESEYFPVSARSTDDMYKELLGFIDTIGSEYIKRLLNSFFVDDAEFKDVFCKHTAAKNVHHSYIGGLIEHSLSVARICEFFAKNYPMMDRDLLISTALLHDIGKTRELATFPLNEYTDEGQLLGHIIIGANMVSERIATIDGFPKAKADEIIHCILAHHGKLEFGSPKLPELMEALALSFADNADAKIEIMIETFEKSVPGDSGWQGYNRFFETSIRPTSSPID